jgi:hypothetical protein
MQTTKYKSVYETQEGKFGGFTWFTEDNIAVKGFLISETQGEKQRVRYELSNLQRGAQEDALFEIPEGYQALNMGGFGGMRNMGQMRQDAETAVGGRPPASAGAKAAPVPVPMEEEEENFFLDVAREAQDTAVESTEENKEETKSDVRDKVRKGIGKLFGR